jgi:cardiolipin synthase A/B
MLMGRLGTILTTLLAIYALGMTVFLISENRRPQATLAWLLAFFFAPGIGVLIYLPAILGRGKADQDEVESMYRQA